MAGPGALSYRSARGPGRELTAAAESARKEVGEGKDAGDLAYGAGEGTGLAGMWTGGG